MEYYIYVYLDPRKPGKYVYGEYQFNYEPFYVGKGSGNRSNTHTHESNRLKGNMSPKIAKIKKLQKLQLSPIIEKIKYFNIENEAYIEEINIISMIGSDYISEIKDGPLTNMVLDGTTPPNLKGKTYIEIYGSVERAEEEKRKRREKLDKIGFFNKTGMKHTDAAKEKMSIKSKERQKIKGHRTGIPHSRDTIQKFSSRRKIDYNITRKMYIIQNPENIIYEVYRITDFCKTFNLSRSTLEKTFVTKKPVKHGRTKSWIILEILPISKEYWTQYINTNISYIIKN